ncbi:MULTISPECIES: hypothetical protein [Spiroplasma]|uniref:hypothetical protein n=1 Tax=Spiroplasma TaxID=2132 RepID=UPI0018DE2842|nr:MULTISPECIES: hypothetical protein [Spiroplasma]MBH8623011.1 hypothetical protein [Spiroplasma sp. hyd1]UNF62640.1 hypothetical protein MNU24_04110 [Spiroplasma poulsonii]
MTDDNEPTDEPAAAKDAKILNEISKRASNSLQKYASKKSMIDETNYDISFEKLYKMVTLTNPSVVLVIDNPDVAKILQLIRTGFNAEFENINREIINDYPNYYPTDEPLAVVENSINYQLNYIDLTQLAKITGVDVTNVNAVRLDFRFNFVVRFKSLETTVPVTISYVLTGNAKIVNDLLSGVVAKVAKPIVNYFNQIKSIKIDSNQDFKKLYDNFDIIYTNNYEELDTIVMHKLNELIKIDDDLAPFKDKITFVVSERMLNLVSASITEAAAGNAAGSNAVFDLVANRTTAKWSGEGFNPNQLTGQNFLNFYRSVMPIFQTNKGILQLGSFNVNLLKVQVAGFPLSGVVADNNNQNLNVSVEVSDQGLNKKLTNFGNIIAAFNKYYRIETYLPGKRSIFHVPTNDFDKIKTYLKSSGDLKKMWSILEASFKKLSYANGLEDLNLFYLGESYKALTTNAMLYYIDGNDNMLYPNASYKLGVTSGGNVYWTFDYRFGVDKDSSFIYSVYSGYWTSFGIIRE